MTLEAWSDEDDKYTSHMPDILQYPNEQTRSFIESIFPEGIYEDYKTDSDLLIGDDGVRIELEVMLPAYQLDEARGLRYRLYRFIEDEIRIIEHGY